MSKFRLSVHSSLAERLKEVDDAWLEQRLETACDEYEDRKGGAELAAYDSQQELRDDEELSETRRKQLLIKWRRRVGGPRR